MQLHRNAKLGLRGRHELCSRSSEDVAEGGRGRLQRVAGDGTPPGRRWRAAAGEERRSLICLHDRSSRPRRSPRMLSAQAQARICAARRRTGWVRAWSRVRPAIPTPPSGGRCGGGALTAAARSPRAAAALRVALPGDLLHIDTKRFSRFTRPGHAVTGIRDRTGAERRLRVGHEFVHSLVDDHSRLAYTELHRDERACDGRRLRRGALAFFAAHGVEAKRLLSDNAWTYTHNRALRELLTRRASVTCSPRSAGRRRTGRSSATSRRSSASGRSGRSTDPPSTAPKRCHTGSSTTTRVDRTAPSAEAHRSAAFTSRGRPSVARSRRGTPPRAEARGRTARGPGGGPRP